MICSYMRYRASIILRKIILAFAKMGNAKISNQIEPLITKRETTVILAFSEAAGYFLSIFAPTVSMFITAIRNIKPRLIKKAISAAKKINMGRTQNAAIQLAKSAPEKIAVNITNLLNKYSNFQKGVPVCS